MPPCEEHGSCSETCAVRPTSVRSNAAVLQRGRWGAGAGQRRDFELLSKEEPHANFALNEVTVTTRFPLRSNSRF